MIKPVVRDTFFLARKSVPATDCPEDRQTIRDLLDTLAANREHCVGMAANMIGVTKRIIVVNAGFVDFIMVNPVITAKDSPRNRRRLPFPDRSPAGNPLSKHYRRISGS